MSWEANIHIYKDKTVLKQLLIAIGLPFGVLVIFLLFVGLNSDSPSRFYGLYLIGLLFVAVVLFLYVMFHNKIRVRYVLNQKNITMKMSDKQARTNQRINKIAMLGGLISLQPSVSIAGMLAHHHQQQTMKLTDIKTLKHDDYLHRLVLKDGMYEFVVQCTVINYEDVKNFIQQHSMF